METQMKQSGLGIASMILGIVGILLSCIVIGIVPAVIGLILAIVGMTRNDKKHGTAIAGLVCSIVAIVIFLIFVFAVNSNGNSANQGEAQKTGTVETQSESDVEETRESNTKEQTEFFVGDIVETEDLKISFLGAGEYTSDNEFIQPKDGNVYYRMEFEFENISDSDQTISSMMNWDCYADDYSVEQSWIGDDSIDANLSPGKKAKGAVYFEVPSDAENIVLEFETNFWTEKKIVFVVK